MGGKYWKELLDDSSVRVSLSLTTLLFMHSDLSASSSKSLHAPIPGQFLVVFSFYFKITVVKRGRVP
jgi:hypothetical protein